MWRSCACCRGSRRSTSASTHPRGGRGLASARRSSPPLSRVTWPCPLSTVRWRSDSSPPLHLPPVPPPPPPPRARPLSPGTSQTLALALAPRAPCFSASRPLVSLGATAPKPMPPLLSPQAQPLSPSLSCAAARPAAARAHVGLRAARGCVRERGRGGLHVVRRAQSGAAAHGHGPLRRAACLAQHTRAAQHHACGAHDEGAVRRARRAARDGRRAPG